MSGDRAREEIARHLFERDYRERGLASPSDAEWHEWVDRNQDEWRQEADALLALPTVRALMAEAAAAALEEAADRPDLKSAMGSDAVGCQTLRDRARALTTHTEETT